MTSPRTIINGNITSIQGIVAASLFTEFVKWVPPNERARFVCFTILGIPAGAAMSYPVAGIINYYWNWKYVFYITGGASILCSLISYLTIKDEPSKDKFITKTERMYLKETCPNIEQRKVVIPWKSILTSRPVLAYWNDRFVESWSNSFLMTCLPLFIKDTYPTNIKDVGILSGIPHLFSMVSTIIYSWIMDYLRSKGTNSRTTLHKTFIMIGQIPAASLLMILGFGLDFQYSMIALSLFKICFASANVCYLTLPLDMSLEHANLINSVAMTFKSVGNMINPIVMGFMVKNHLSEEWHRYFWFLSIFNLWGAIVFAKYGSGEVQPWAHSYINTEEPCSSKEMD
ncbi:hypothetical protein V9T40_010046 [Parthenolecanium corni]|uniref:Major facilitator superfamily (MFS) profile domain-containing protein n=1 Tax=Parthenolecanium corni TaxID=536013 RepID=A0AAN9TNZ1_9HEMI